MVIFFCLCWQQFLGKSKPYPSEKEKVVQDEMKSKIDEISASVEELKNTPSAVVAFRATCVKNFPSVYTPYKVIWTNTEYNIGNAFDETKGTFTCPYDGIYSFYATSAVYNSKKWQHLYSY